MFTYKSGECEPAAPSAFLFSAGTCGSVSLFPPLKLYILLQSAFIYAVTERLWVPSLLLVGVQTCIATLEISMAISQKIRKQPTLRLSRTTFGYMPKGCSIIPQEHVLNYVHIALFVAART